MLLDFFLFVLKVVQSFLEINKKEEISMKKWETPEVVELSISATAQSTYWNFDYDDVKTDANGMSWVSFVSGGTEVPKVKH